MHVRLKTLVAALITCSAPAWAATGNVDVYGVFGVSVDTLSASGTYSAAADIGTNFFAETPFVPTVSVSETAGQTATIALTTYNAQAKTTLGGNHALTQASGFGNGAFGVNSFSGWYDQVTIGGGTGTGTVQFSVQLNGVVTAGAYLGAAGYGLLASTVHPSQLVSSTPTFNVLQPAIPMGLDPSQATEIASYSLLASPYSDPNQLAGLFASPTTPSEGIPSLPIDPSMQLGSDASAYAYPPDLILTPGANQIVNVTLTGTLTFTYGQAFYLIGALASNVVDTTALLSAFEPFGISENPISPLPDGSGATTLDFFNSAHLTAIMLPQGASFASASGAAYSVTAVPEPGEWLMLLAGLSLVGWRVRHRA